jgi:hypothetical protein
VSLVGSHAPAQHQRAAFFGLELWAEPHFDANSRSRHWAVPSLPR